MKIEPSDGLMSDFRSILFQSGTEVESGDLDIDTEAIVNDGEEESPEFIGDNIDGVFESIHQLQQRSNLVSNRFKETLAKLQAEQLRTVLRQLGTVVPPDCDLSVLLHTASEVRRHHNENSQRHLNPAGAATPHSRIEELSYLIRCLDDAATESSVAEESEEDDPRTNSSFINQSLQRYVHAFPISPILTACLLISDCDSGVDGSSRGGTGRGWTWPVVGSGCGPGFSSSRGDSRSVSKCPLFLSLFLDCSFSLRMLMFSNVTWRCRTSVQPKLHRTRSLRSQLRLVLQQLPATRPSFRSRHHRPAHVRTRVPAPDASVSRPAAASSCGCLPRSPSPSLVWVVLDLRPSRQ